MRPHSNQCRRKLSFLQLLAYPTGHECILSTIYVGGLNICAL